MGYILSRWRIAVRTGSSPLSFGPLVLAREMLTLMLSHDVDGRVDESLLRVPMALSILKPPSRSAKAKIRRSGQGARGT